MPNKNYRKGYEKERKIVNEARAKGHVAFRSAGSHSPVDCVLIDPIKKEIVFVQAKPKTMSDNAKRKIEEENKNLNGLFNCFFIVK